MTAETLWSSLQMYAVHLMVLAIICYAIWHGLQSRLQLSSWFREAGFQRMDSESLKLSPRIGDEQRSSLLLDGMANWNRSTRALNKAWHGSIEARSLWQFVTLQRRSHVLLRKKNNKRTRYNVTVSAIDNSDLYFCLRPKRVLDAIDYVFEQSDVEFADWGNFGESYQIITNDGDKLHDLLGEPLRDLLLEVEGVSLELIGGHLVLVRINQYFDQRSHLQTERETVLTLADYLEARL